MMTDNYRSYHNCPTGANKTGRASDMPEISGYQGRHKNSSDLIPKQKTSPFEGATGGSNIKRGAYLNAIFKTLQVYYNMQQK